MTAAAERPSKSTFVTVLAWISIIFSGLGVLMTALQNLMISTMPKGQMDPALADSALTAHLPAPALFMFRHLQLVFALVFVATVLGLIASIGLLKRRNWARILYLGLMVFGILYMIASLFVEWGMFSQMNEMAGTMADSAARADNAMMTQSAAFRRVGMIMSGVMLVIVGGFIALYIWIIAKLCSARIRSEFVTE